MKIVVSGTHASGKSTLISDFTTRHPEFAVLPDPFELIDEAWDAPGAAMFAQQLRVSADRLNTAVDAADLIAERGPLDFLAYLIALDELADGEISPELLVRSREITSNAMAVVDLIVVLPLAASNPIDVSDDEHPELRALMNDVLLELVDDDELIAKKTRVLEVVGNPEQRLAIVDDALGSIRRT